MNEEKTPDEIRAEEKKAMEVVEEKAEEGLAKLRDDEPTPDESTDESTSEQSEEDQTDESKDTDESTSEQTDKSESEEEPTSEETSEETEQTDDANDSEADVLTQAEIRAAIHLGWSEDEVNELAQANPDLAKKTCAKALESTNNLSKKFSELGKAQIDKKPESDPKPEQKPEAKPVDFTALEKQYEDDPIVDAFKQVVDQNQAMATEINALRTDSAQSVAKVSNAKIQEDAAISQQIDTFFARPDVTAYKDVYGEVEKGSRDWDGLTQGQIKKRYTVVEEAQRILFGAQALREDMPMEEAFERAHLLVTKDEQEQTIRKTIKAKAVKRAKSLTLAPTGSKKVSNTGAKTMDEVHANAKQGLQKLRS